MRSNCELYAKRMGIECDFIRTVYEWYATVMRLHTNGMRMVCDFMQRKAKQRKEKQIKQKQTKIIFKFVCEF